MDYKKAKNSEEQLAISIGITKFLEVCCFDDIIQIDAYLADILDNLFPNVSNLSEQSFITDESDQVSPSSIQMKLRSEAFTCFCIAASRFADKEVYNTTDKG